MFSESSDIYLVFYSIIQNFTSMYTLYFHNVSPFIINNVTHCQLIFLFIT